MNAASELRVPPVQTSEYPLRQDEQGVQALIQHCQSGDYASWNTLIHRYQKDIYRVAYSLSRNREDAEDVTSQVFVRLYQSLRTFRNESSFRPWLFCIVHRTFLDMCVRPLHRSRHLVAHVRSTDDEFASVTMIMDSAPSPEGIYLEKEAHQILTQAIQQLPLIQREVLGRLYNERKSYKEIARDAGVPVGTVKSRLNRAHKLLRKTLIPYQERLAST
jgi:RNA polymerase sigma-70 factor (ECF subfamily)